MMIPRDLVEARTIHHAVYLRRDSVLVMLGAEQLLATGRAVHLADALQGSFAALAPHVDGFALHWALNFAAPSSTTVDRLSPLQQQVEAIGLTRAGMRRAIRRQAAYMRSNAADYRERTTAAVEVFDLAIALIQSDWVRGAESETGRNISIAALDAGEQGLRASGRYGHVSALDGVSDGVSAEYLRIATHPVPPGLPDTNVERFLRAGGPANTAAAVGVMRMAQWRARIDVPRLGYLATWRPPSLLSRGSGPGARPWMGLGG